MKKTPLEGAGQETVSALPKRGLGTFLRQNSRKAPWILLGFMGVWFLAALAVLPGLNAPVILPDEFGYWAQAAAMTGRDWSGTVSQFSWYSFGYGLLMFPFMAVIQDPTTLYQVMAGVNFGLMGLGTIVLYRFLGEAFGAVKKKYLALGAGTGLLYVSCVTYAQTTLAETLLSFLYLLLAWGMVKWLQHPGLWRGLLPVLAAGFMYMVHLRTVGILLGTGLCMVLGAVFRDKKPGSWKRILLLLAILGSVAILTGAVKGTLVSEVGSTEYQILVQTNDYAGQWGKLAYLCSLEGLYRFFTGLLGKVFYLGCASFGLYYWGMALLLRQTGKLLTSMRKSSSCVTESLQEWCCLWLLLSHGAALLVTNIYCLGSDRMDAFLYGRYHENTVPPILALGVVELLTAPGMRRRLLWLTGLLGGGFLAVYSILGSGEILYANRHSVTGILYAFDLAERYDTRTILYAYGGGMLGGTVLLAAFHAARDRGWRRGFLLAPCLLQLGLSGYNAVTYILPAHEWQREDVELLLQAGEMLRAEGQENVLCLYGDRGTRACLAQYMLGEISLQLTGKEEELPRQGEIFLLQRDGREELHGEYMIVMESSGYRVCLGEE